MAAEQAAGHLEREHGIVEAVVRLLEAAALADHEREVGELADDQAVELPERARVALVFLLDRAACD
jgi:hypothetical protein